MFLDLPSPEPIQPTSARTRKPRGLNINVTKNEQSAKEAELETQENEHLRSKREGQQKRATLPGNQINIYLASNRS